MGDVRENCRGGNFPGETVREGLSGKEWNFSGEIFYGTNVQAWERSGGELCGSYSGLHASACSRYGLSPWLTHRHTPTHMLCW